MINAARVAALFGIDPVVVLASGNPVPNTPKVLWCLRMAAGQVAHADEQARQEAMAGSGS